MIHAILPPNVRKLMDKAPWREVSPGKREREITFAGITFKELQICCQDCGSSGMGPMLENHIWLEIAPNDGLLCITCMERRLGRPLSFYDLKVVPMNQTAQYFARRC